MGSDSDCEQAGPSNIAKKIKYSQNYKEDWEKLEDFERWLSRSKKGKNFARCKICSKDINISSGKDSLMKHSLSIIHKHTARMIRKQPRLTEFSAGMAESAQIKNNIAEAEIRLSAFIAEHNLPFLVMDHLPKLIANICPDSKIAQGISCARKKTTAIVRNVIGAECFENICEDIKYNKFSLIIDESTDRSTIKHLCLVVRYAKDNLIRDCFFALVKLDSANAETLYNHVINTFVSNSVPYKDNMIGFASDGANVMMGRHHSVTTLLKKDIPNLFVMKCICHSFHLVASYACEKLPNFLENLTRNIFNYFNSSPKRISEFQEYQLFCNVKIHKILHPSQTRWLSVDSAIKRILEQYNPLRLYFTTAVADGDVSTAENILDHLNNPLTKVFLLFLDYVLPLFNSLNREMQSESPKLYTLYNSVSNIFRTICDCFLKRNYLLSTALENIEFKNPHNYQALEDLYLGANVRIYLEEGKLSSEQIKYLRLRCLDFYVESCSQITTRFPLKNNPLKKFNFIDPEIVKSGTISSIADIALLFPNLIPQNELENLDSEWRQLRNYTERQNFSTDMLEFWASVRAIKRGDESNVFPLLCNFIQNLLCLPHSSANVERIFSSINLMKTKQRTKLSTETVTGLLHSKTYINKNSCFDFKIDKKLILKINEETLKNIPDDE